MRREVRQIGDRDHFVLDLSSDLLKFLMRPLEELLQDSEFVHQLESRRMNRIAAEIAEEIGMLFEHDDIHPRTSQKKTGDHPGRPSARDAATRLYRF
jgi:hypothetical protein